MVGGALLGAAANRQVCPTISEMTFGNQSRTGEESSNKLPGFKGQFQQRTPRLDFGSWHLVLCFEL